MCSTAALLLPDSSTFSLILWFSRCFLPYAAQEWDRRWRSHSLLEHLLKARGGHPAYKHTSSMSPISCNGICRDSSSKCAFTVTSQGPNAVAIILPQPSPHSSHCLLQLLIVSSLNLSPDHAAMTSVRHKGLHTHTNTHACWSQGGSQQVLERVYLDKTARLGP